MCDHEERSIEDPYGEWKASNYRDLAESFAEEHSDAFEEHCKSCYEAEHDEFIERQLLDQERV
jgi:hypothetical protein